MSENPPTDDSILILSYPNRGGSRICRAWRLQHQVTESGRDANALLCTCTTCVASASRSGCMFTHVLRGLLKIEDTFLSCSSP
jgi:hypothetical protein